MPFYHNLFITLVGVQTNFRVDSYLIRVIHNKESRMYSYIAKSVINEHLGSSNDLCYIQNCVIKRLRSNLKHSQLHVPSNLYQ